MPTPNVALARKVLDHIEANPDEWNQGYWAHDEGCGTTYCFAGHTVHLAHPEAKFLFGQGDAASREATLALIPGEGRFYIKTLAKELLGLDSRSAEVMFELSNTLEHLRDYVEQMQKPGFTGHLTCINTLFHAIDPYDEDA